MPTKELPTDYLTAVDVMAMHTELIGRYGGPVGLRDAAALQAALHRPQSGYYLDIVSQAAAMMESLAMNHPFVDGNKRIAFAATDVFLRINGWRLDRSSAQIYAEMIAMLESRRFDFANLEPWLRGFASKPTGPSR